MAGGRPIYKQESGVELESTIKHLHLKLCSEQELNVQPLTMGYMYV